MKERAGKGGVASNSVYYSGVTKSNNSADKYYTAQGNTGANNMKFKITQLQDNGKTLTGKGKTLAEARKELESQIKKAAPKKK